MHSFEAHTPGVHSENDRTDQKRLAFSIGLNLAITIAEVIGGLLSGSLALLSDALHNLNDTASQAISYYARRVGRRDASSELTFGYSRFETVAAFFNLVTLFVVALLLVKEGVERFFDPQPVRGGVMLGVAAAGLVVNVLSALLLRHGAKRSLNMKSAYLHIVTDAVSSVAVVFGALVVLQFGFQRVDPILTVLISMYIMHQGYGVMRQTVRVLMNSAPPGMSTEAVAAAIAATNGVQGVHHVHLWLMDEHAAALEAHVVIDHADLESMGGIKQSIKERLSDEFGIQHSTLEFEDNRIATSEYCGAAHGGEAHGGKHS